MLESRSKFACLNIDDDSDEEFTSVSKSKKGGHQGAGGQRMKNGGNLIVHAIEKKPKAKRGNKQTKVVDTATGLVVQGADENYVAEQKYREELKRAMRESAQMAVNRSPSSNSEKTPPPAAEASHNEQHNPSLIDKILDSIEEESKKQAGVNADAKGDPVVVALYRSKLTEAKAQAAHADVEKYRTKYRKLVELFRDAELSEKAKLVMDLEKTRASEAELASQLVIAQKELEQYRSKLRALGALK
ncbi:hypothetical protein Y032_0014g2346 [Ancylostoma ceylanicum]|uniref:Uncharacterized protein n=1 Tax=Ancylostoma ceylanicum TaxID=53326 RepID=A0A016V9P0_9BILA|nr:hypothetical protein Y032_0014g2346 [Ancylostoma ceylanicum]